MCVRQTALHAACIGGSVEVVAYLLLRSSVVTPDIFGRTPQSYAIEYNKDGIVSLFMARAAIGKK